MYELILTVCTLVQGAHCKDLASVKIDSSSTPMACLVASQMEGANWINEHPNFYLHKVTCQPYGIFTKA